MRRTCIAGLIARLIVALVASSATPSSATPSSARADAAAPLTVVIDPGHGGSNTGAAARAPGRYEKQVTLAIARALRARLERDGVRVVMTRDRDEYLTLRERSRRANAAHADCFLSLHANASPDHGHRGVETYVLDRQLVDVDARRAAERTRAGVPALLADLAVLESHHAAMRLARALQARLVRIAAPSPSPASGAVDRGVHEAVYDVLAGADAPAVLIEVGFIDHPIEGVRLLDPDGQRQIADAIADGLFDYFVRPRYAAR
jgi:N-acetylmuramoyl-L-alanine amidase